MNYFLNTPLQIPLPLPFLTPFLTAEHNFPSPMFSPYNGLQENQNHSYHQALDGQFSSFRLEAPAETIQKLEEQEIDLLVEEQIKETKQQATVKNYIDDSQDESMVCEDNCEISNKIRNIIEYLVKFGDKSDDKLQIEKMKYVGNDRGLREIFQILLKKFRKLKKTKEEMTKYCMRKAFKFLADKYRKTLDGKDTSSFLKQYFEQVETEGFCIPFKKNSDEKTMNANFLRKVFSSTSFAEDYKLFLRTFSKVVEEDNVKKIKYLTVTIKSFYNANCLKKLENVKRLPWTQTILNKTVDLATNLVLHSEDEGAREMEGNQKRKEKGKGRGLTRTHSMRRKSTVSLAETFGSPVNTFDAQ